MRTFMAPVRCGDLEMPRRGLRLVII
jgi:hypothetical protein